MNTYMGGAVSKQVFIFVVCYFVGSPPRESRTSSSEDSPIDIGSSTEKPCRIFVEPTSVREETLADRSQAHSRCRYWQPLVELYFVSQDAKWSMCTN
jgi:hypothetical protein